MILFPKNKHLYQQEEELFCVTLASAGLAPNHRPSFPFPIGSGVIFFCFYLPFLCFFPARSCFQELLKVLSHLLTNEERERRKF